MIYISCDCNKYKSEHAVTKPVSLPTWFIKLPQVLIPSRALLPQSWSAVSPAPPLPMETRYRYLDIDCRATNPVRMRRFRGKKKNAGRFSLPFNLRQSDVTRRDATAVVKSTRLCKLIVFSLVINKTFWISLEYLSRQYFTPGMFSALIKSGPRLR